MITRAVSSPKALTSQEKQKFGRKLFSIPGIYLCNKTGVHGATPYLHVPLKCHPYITEPE